MKYDKEIAALTIRNIATIESSLRVVHEAQSILFKAISLEVKKIIESSSINAELSQYRQFDWDATDGESYFSVKSWEDKNSENLLANYSLDLGEIQGDETEEYWALTSAVGAFNTSLSIGIYLDYEQNGIGKRAYKQRLIKAFKTLKPLGKKGFKLTHSQDAVIYTFHLDKDAIANEYPNMDNCLQPARDAINKVIEAHPHFKALVQEVLHGEEASSS